MCGWLFSLWKDMGAYLPVYEGRLARALLITFIILILTASQLTAHFAALNFAILTSLFLAAAFDSKQAIDKF